jgi:hypothetical protein
VQRSVGAALRRARRCIAAVALLAGFPWIGPTQAQTGSGDADPVRPVESAEATPADATEAAQQPRRTDKGFEPSERVRADSAVAFPVDI